MSRPYALILLGLMAIGQVPARAQAGGQYIVTFRRGTGQSDRASAVQRAGGAVRFNYSIVDAVAIRIPNSNVLAVLQNHPSVLAVIPDRAVHAIPHGDVGENGKPSGGGGGGAGEVMPEGVKRVGEPTSSSNGSGIGVAILDTGIDLQNADLAPSADRFSAFGGSCQDDNDHGTHVAGIVGALQGNNLGTVGVAPAAVLYCVKVLDATGSGSDSDVIAGLEWVANHSAIRVVNMSLGRPGTVNDNPLMRDAIKALYAAGVTVVVAAGNDSSKDVSQMVPASYPEVLSVASTTAIAGTNSCRRFSGKIGADTASYFSTDGMGLGWDATDHWLGGVTVSAPGEDEEDISQSCLISSKGILSTKRGGGVVRMSGTSMASPHVAGIAARMVQKGVSGPEAIRHSLRNFAQSAGSVPLDSPASSYSFDGEREGIAKAP
jgi:subtilisin family serine protease